METRQLAPSIRHRFAAWRLSIVLQAITKAPFKWLKLVEPKFLSWKLDFLVVVISTRRMSEMAPLSSPKDLCIFKKKLVALRTDSSFKPKVNSGFLVNQWLILPSFCLDRRLPKEKRLTQARYVQCFAHTPEQNSYPRTQILSLCCTTAKIRVKEYQNSPLWTLGEAVPIQAYEAQDSKMLSRITLYLTRFIMATAAFSTRPYVVEIYRAAPLGILSSLCQAL